MKPVVRVLLVTDDFGGPGSPPFGGYLRWQDQSASAAIGTSSREFHLGEFVKVLEDTAWLGFNVELTKAHRSLPGTVGMNEAALKADRGADVVGFRFNQPFTVAGATRTCRTTTWRSSFQSKLATPSLPGGGSGSHCEVHGSRRRFLCHRRSRQLGRHVVRIDPARTQHAALVGFGGSQRSSPPRRRRWA